MTKWLHGSTHALYWAVVCSHDGQDLLQGDHYKLHGELDRVQEEKIGCMMSRIGCVMSKIGCMISRVG